MRKHGLKVIDVLLIILLLLGVLWIGLAARWETDSVTPQELIQKYQKQDDANRRKTRYGVEKKESLSYDFAFDYSQKPALFWDNLITVHTERSCQEESQIIVGVNVVSQETGCKVTVSPIEQALATESDKEENWSWGSAPMYYLAIHYDTEAQKEVKLDRPVIVPFTLKSACAVPNLQGDADETGVFRLSWSPVEGASEYRVYNYYISKETDKTTTVESVESGAESGYHNGTLIFEKSVSGTSFESFSGDDRNETRIYSYKNNREIVLGQNYGVQGEYYVTAVVDGEESVLSNAVYTEDRKLPREILEEEDILYQRYDSVEELPRSLPVVNTDGTVEERNVLYTFRQEKNLLGAPFRQYWYEVEGTRLKGYVVMRGEKETDYPETIGLPSLAGQSVPRDDSDQVPQVSEEQDTSSRTQRNDRVSKVDPAYYVMADSAAEEWLALNLMEGQEEIYIGDFPELTEPEGLREIFYHVYYQNPYVFGIASFLCDYEQLILKVEYLYSAEEQKRMRQEMKEAAETILRENHLYGEEGESKKTEEKIQTIYQWLERNGSYDWEAYEDNLKNQYQKSGKEFEYANNAYGMLVRHKGMCQAYTDAFLLLCHMVEVQAVAVSGYISQNIPHVWNAVALEGNWYYVDVTNNETNTGTDSYLYLAGEEQAKEKHYVRDNRALGEDQQKISFRDFQ